MLKQESGREITRPGAAVGRAGRGPVAVVFCLLLVVLAVTTLLQVPAATAQQIDEETEEDIDKAVIAALKVTHLTSTAASLSPDPFTSFAADNIALASNIALKFIKSPLDIPADRDFLPTVSFTDPETGVTDSDCLHQFRLPQSLYKQQDVFGINITNVLRGQGPILGVPTDWGDLGTPDISHYNTHVALTASNIHIEQSDLPQTVSLPAGNHIINWQADTMYDLFFDALLPAALVAASGYGKYKRGEFLLSQPSAVEKLAKTYRANQLAGKSIFKKLGIAIKDACTTRPEKCVKLVYTGAAGPAADFFTDTEIVSVSRSKQQMITVYDLHDPTITVKTPELVIEAADFGGTFLERVRDQVQATVKADDACGRSVSLGNDLPSLLPIGPIDVTWTATDLGPNEDGGRNSVQSVTRIVVQDTQPPIIVPPPARVIEVDPTDFDASDGLDADGVNPAVVDLGVPRVVDLADPSPTIATDAPEFFPVNSRTEVLWSATDDGYPTPNTSTASQLITVKQKGTNTAPSVRNISTTTLTSEPVDIRLTGLDNDVLDGRVDPVAMEIVERPRNGEFVAPLLPYFIEDFRTSPEGPYGEDFYLASPRGNWLYDNLCQKGSGPSNSRIRRDWPFVPRFVEVTDEGTYFMIDTYWTCQPSNADARPRISKWDRDGNYLGQIDYGGTTDAFVMDQDGFIYTITRTGAGSSTTMSLSQIKPTFDTDSDFSRDLWKFDFNSTGDDPVANEQYSYARVDSRRGLVYVNDRRRIFVFDVRTDLADPERNSRNGMGDVYLGALKGGERVFACTSFGSSWSGFAMEVDSRGNLYVADTCGDRIHKFEASGFDDKGNFQPGAYVGWMGRCDTSTNKSCDEETGTTRGYSCTDETCSVGTTEGAGPGQFSTPVYLAADPNDILYVADSSNRRIQRFADDGSFAGQAQSTGTGINQGSNPSFVLGNMGIPKAVSVNSSQFFVVDQQESFIHVFETTPLKQITDDGATVTYVSNFDFHSGSDSFTYLASDGLADSNPGTVTIRVNRNFRAPEVEEQSLTTAEDTPLRVTLLGDDPDGVIGVDFNGLDTLTFEVVEEPTHGVLTGVPPNLTYNPDADFFGEDSFTYKANDGVLDSEEAVVALRVTEVNDAVRLSEASWPARVGRGFPTLFMGEFSDDGGAEYSTFMRWTEGDIDVEGDFVDPDGEQGPEPPFLDGVKLIEPADRVGNGMALADHVYTETGNFAARFCIADDLAQSCSDEIIQVEELVNLAVELEPGEAETTDPRFDLTLTVMNGKPEGWQGLTAGGLQVELSQPEGYRLVGFNVSSASANCALADGGLQCSPQALAPGATFTVDLTVEPDTPAIYDEQAVPVILSVTTSTPAVDDTYIASRSVRFTVDDGDNDGDGMNNSFEKKYGLDPASASDAAADNDADGLSNLEEFEARTDPTDRDSDDDGIRDGLDPDPLNADPAGENTDLNGDGTTDAADVLLLQQALRGDYSAELDLNDDGLTDAADLMLLQKRLTE